MPSPCPSHAPSARRDALILVVYLLLALALTWPLAARLATHNLGEGVDDPALTWALWWTRFALLDLGASPLQTDYIFYPVGVNLVAYTPTFLNGIVSIPLQFAFGVVAAQNLLVFFALVAGGYGTLLLARETMARAGIAPCRRTDLAAALAGAFYAFGAWHFHYVAGANFFLLHNQWLPFYALYLLRWSQQPFRSGARAGIFLVLTAWTELTFTVFLAILTGLYLLYVIAGQIPKGFSSSSRHSVTLSAFPHLRPLATALAALAFVTAIGVSPLIINLASDTLRHGYYLAEGTGRYQIFSAEPISFFVPSYHHPLLGEWAHTLTDANTQYAFLGYAALILAGIGRCAAREARFWAALALLCALVMLGPTLIVAGQNTGVPMPFALLRAIPFVNANRYPVRFNVMLALSLAPLLAFGAAHLLRTRRGTFALLALLALLAFEQRVYPLPLNDLRVPALYQTIRDTPGDFAILELPLGWRGSIPLQGKLDDAAQFFQTAHHKRLLGGITSRTPRYKFQYFLEAPVINSLIALETGREVDETRRAQDRAAAPAVVRFFDIRYVVVNRAKTDAAVLAYAREVLALEELARDDTRTLYHVQPSTRALDVVNPADETARLYFDDGWGRAQISPAGFGYRWATRGDALIWLPLEGVEQTITFRLRGTRLGQPLTVRVNGHVIARWSLGVGWDDYAARVPATLARAGLNEFVFETETAPVRVTPQDDYAIGDTGVVAPVDISATGAGYDAGKFGEIFVAGRNVIASQRGYHLVAIDAHSGAVERVGVFDTFADANESARLAQFVAELPRGTIVAGVAVDDVSRNLQASAIDALRALGVEGDLRDAFRAGHAFIGVKGAPPGSAREQVDGRFPANVAVGKNVASDRVAFALGEIKVTREQ